LLKDKATLEDLGLKLRFARQQQAIILESNSNIINADVERAAQETASGLSLKTLPVLSYLANSIAGGDLSVPYSLVSAIDSESFRELASHGNQIMDDYSGLPPIIINEWTARELKARVADHLALEYYVWQEGGRLETRKADFVVVSIVPIAGLAADRDLVPAYPGITESENISANGVLFQVDSDMPVGSMVDFTISLPADVVGSDADVQLDCRGRVVRSYEEDGRRGVGVVIDEYHFERR
jgi:hypothetical protein